MCTFLDRLDDKLYQKRRDVIQLQLFPTVKQAFTLVLRETIHQTVINDDNLMKLLERYWHPGVLNLSHLFNLQQAEATKNLQRLEPLRWTKILTLWKQKS